MSKQSDEFLPTDHEQYFVVQREHQDGRCEVARRQFEWFDPESGTEGYPPEKITMDIHTSNRNADSWLIAEKGDPRERVIEAGHESIKRVWRVIQEIHYGR
jgi:hypothetical protein